jgi:hypothetical protein
MNAQEVTNTLWAFAALRRVRDGLLGILTARAEEILGQFNALGLANLLWALAAMRRTVGERMLALLERRVEQISGMRTHMWKRWALVAV